MTRDLLQVAVSLPSNQDDTSRDGPPSNIMPGQVVAEDSPNPGAPPTVSTPSSATLTEPLRVLVGTLLIILGAFPTGWAARGQHLR